MRLTQWKHTGCFLLPRINLWELKGPIGAETAFKHKMNYISASLPSKYDYKQPMVQTLFISTLCGKEDQNTATGNSFIAVIPLSALWFREGQNTSCGWQRKLTSFRHCQQKLIVGCGDPSELATGAWLVLTMMTGRKLHYIKRGKSFLFYKTYFFDAVSYERTVNCIPPSR